MEGAGTFTSRYQARLGNARPAKLSLASNLVPKYNLGAGKSFFSLRETANGLNLP